MTKAQTADETKKPLPKGWRWVKLGEVCQFVGGSQPPKGNFKYEPTSGYVRLVQIQDFRLSDVAVFIPEQMALRTFEVSDVMIGRYGPPVFQILRGLSGAYNVALMKTAPSEKLDKDFLYFLLQWPEIQRDVIAQSQRSAGQSGVSKEYLEKYVVPLPPISLQRRLSAELNELMPAVARARAAAQERLESVKTLPAALLRQVFPQPGQNPPDGWRWVKLGEVASQGPNNGVFKRREDFGSGVPLVNVSDLFRSLYVDLSQTERVRVTEDEKKQYQIEPGDLFFCRSSLKREGIGWCCLVKEVKEPSVFECHVMRVRLNPTDAMPEFVAYYWQHPAVREAVIENSRTATMTTMNQQDLGGIMIPLPSLLEQQRIAGFLSEQMATVAKARIAAEAELQTINALPAAMLRRVFSGEI